MASSAEYEAQRLDRLEREARRRKWDSVVVGRGRDSAVAMPSPPLLPQAEPATATTPPFPDPYAVMELMADRLDHLERVACRLEGEIQRAERRGRRRVHVIYGVAAAGIILLALLPLFGNLWQVLGGLAGQ